MKLCPNHWATLSEALKAHGIKNAEPQQMQGTPDSLSPALMMASLLITKSALHVEGIRMADRMCCPICELKTEHWIELVAKRVEENILHPTPAHFQSE